MSSSTPAQLRARVALALLIALAAAWIGAAFVPAILWAGVVAIAVEPLRVRLLAALGDRPTLIALILTAAVLLVIVVPLAIALPRAVIEARGVMAWIAEAREHGVPVPAWVGTLPFGAAQITDWWNAHLLTGAAASAELARLDAHVLRPRSSAFTHGLVRSAVVFAFTVVILFFLLRDRDSVVGQLDRGATRAFGSAGQRLGQQIFASVRGTIDGLVLLGLAQGIVMCVIYAFAGVPHAILMGLGSGLASIIPFGLIVVLLLAVLLLFIQGAVVPAIVVGVLGYAINFVIDHLVRPSLIGGATRMPFVWVLIGIVGGVETIGLLGLFVGPAVMAALVLLWREWVAEGDIGTPEGDAEIPAG